MNLGKILLLLGAVSTAVMIYLNAPPRGTVVFFIILLGLAIPFLYYFWNARKDIQKMKAKNKWLSIGAVLIMLVFAVLWYSHEYKRLVYFTGDTPEGYLYFPLQENETLSEMLEAGGGSLEGTVEHFGFSQVQEKIDLNTTKSDYLVTDAYFILLAILGYFSFFLILLFMYTAIWKERAA